MRNELRIVKEEAEENLWYRGKEIQIILASP